MLQVDIKGKEGVVHMIGWCKAYKMYWTEPNNCTTKPPEKIEVEKREKHPRPAGLAPI